jgi:hypothetical protein
MVADRSMLEHLAPEGCVRDPAHFILSQIGGYGDLDT